MSNEIPNAKRLVPPDKSNSTQPQKANEGLPYAAIVAMVAIPIVVVGIALALVVRSWVGNGVNADVNDTRSPLAGEFAPAEAPADATSASSDIDAAPAEAASAQTESDKPFDYGDIDPNKEPLDVAVNPRVSGLSGSDASSDAAALSDENIAAVPIDKYGHLPYPETQAPLSSVGLFVRENYERAEQLDEQAAQAFEAMRQAAQAEGVNLMPVSGFRRLADQADLFAAQVNRKGSAAAAAEFSAPPGYSEHHTGFAIDITDADYPDSDIKYSFANTPAYQWLKNNAYKYDFEESFPQNNRQGVTFEPWHWRYVGSDRARQTFAEAQRLYPSR